MGLRAKFNLVLLVVFLIALGASAVLSRQILRENAVREVSQEAAIMIAQATAIRGYTTREIRPLLAEQMKVRFLPHTVPSWSAQTNLRALTAQFPDYSYKEAALDPTNPADKAADWEADIIAEFQHNPSLKEYTGFRDTPGGPVMSVARPFRITDKDCLTCHSVPAAAPAPMIELYGTANGFNWKLNDVIGAQIVSVPMRVALDRANEVFYVFLAELTGVFLATIVILNLLLHFMIIRPIGEMSKIASEVSLGKSDAPEFAVKGKDEIASLAQSFVRMRRSLTNALRLLEA